jgi:hypothetical protein
MKKMLVILRTDKACDCVRKTQMIVENNAETVLQVCHNYSYDSIAYQSSNYRQLYTKMRVSFQDNFKK